VIARAHHLNDERLLDRYLAERAGEMPDPPVAEHLADCEECGLRYDELGRFLDDLRAEGDADTDAIFTAERMRVQHQQIAGRLEHVGRAARVISFPGRLVSRHIRRSTGHGVPRWTYAAAAAAAALVLGVGLGTWYDSGWRTVPRPHQFSAQRPTSVAPVATSGAKPVPDAAADEAFLTDLELALERPRTRELQPFDALTPHVREVADKR
jgi:hypothetical protein